MVEANESSSSRSTSEDKKSSKSPFGLPLIRWLTFLEGADGTKNCFEAVDAENKDMIRCLSPKLIRRLLCFLARGESGHDRRWKWDIAVYGNPVGGRRGTFVCS